MRGWRWSLSIYLRSLLPAGEKHPGRKFDAHVKDASVLLVPGTVCIEGRPMTTWEGPSVEAITDVHRLTLGDFLVEACATHGPREALVFDAPLRDGTTVRWSYADLERESRAVAAALIER